MAKYQIKKEVRTDGRSWYYWLLWSDRNNKIVAKSSESYSSKQGALDSISWTRANADTNDIEDLT